MVLADKSVQVFKILLSKFSFFHEYSNLSADQILIEWMHVYLSLYYLLFLWEEIFLWLAMLLSLFFEHTSLSPLKKNVTFDLPNVSKPNKCLSSKNYVKKRQIPEFYNNQIVWMNLNKPHSKYVTYVMARVFKTTIKTIYIYIVRENVFPIV